MAQPRSTTRRPSPWICAAQVSFSPFLVVYLGVSWLLWGDGSVVSSDANSLSALGRWLCFGWLPSAALALASLGWNVRRGGLAPWSARAAWSYAGVFLMTLPGVLWAVESSVHALHRERVVCDGQLYCAIANEVTETADETPVFAVDETTAVPSSHPKEEQASEPEPTAERESLWERLDLSGLFAGGGKSPAASDEADGAAPGRGTQRPDPDIEIGAIAKAPHPSGRPGGAPFRSAAPPAPGPGAGVPQRSGAAPATDREGMAGGTAGAMPGGTAGEMAGGTAGEMPGGMPGGTAGGSGSQTAAGAGRSPPAGLPETADAGVTPRTPGSTAQVAPPAAASPSPSESLSPSQRDASHEALERFPDGARRRSGGHVLDPATGSWSKDGPWTEWAENGQKIAQGDYRKGEKDGTWRQWHPNGRPKSFERFSRGKPEGRCQRWHPNGRLAYHRDELRTDDGHVLWIEDHYYDIGARQLRRQVRDGVPHGPSESWHKSRKQAAVGAFAHGAKDGIWLYWDDAGRELGREIWLAGELRGRPVVSERVPPPE